MLGVLSWVMSHGPVALQLVVLEKRTNGQAAACAGKHLPAASVARGWWDLEMRGMIARVLMPSPVQAVIQWLLEILTVVPSSKLRDELHFACGLISRGRG